MVIPVQEAEGLLSEEDEESVNQLEILGEDEQRGPQTKEP